MKRIIAAMAALALSVGCFAQDMIVKKDGSIIQAKVSEIGTSEVKYKKWSNQDGPSYAIAKSDILAITYQNGEKETFENATSNTSNVPSEVSSKELVPSTDNADAIRIINNATITINDPKLVAKKKTAKLVCVQYAVSDNSILKSDILSVKFEFGDICTSKKLSKFYPSLGEYTSGKNKGKVYAHDVLGNPAVSISLTNNSNKILYIDLANTFLSVGQVPEAFYVPTATTTSTTSTSGGSFNLGGITNALGVGGIAGSLANATTVGRSSGSTTSNVVFSQRIISIPPHSTISLPEKNIEDKKFISSFYTSNYGCDACEILTKKSFYIGEEVLYNESNSPYGLKFYTTVSFTEDFKESFTSPTNLYCAKILGIDHDGAKVFVNNDILDISDNGLYTFGRCRAYE